MESEEKAKMIQNLEAETKFQSDFIEELKKKLAEKENFLAVAENSLTESRYDFISSKVFFTENNFHFCFFFYYHWNSNVKK